MANKFAFLPDAMTPLAAVAADPAAGGMRRRAAYDVAVLANDAATGPAISVSSDVLGAGDITGLDPRMIARLEPRADAVAFEPNYMPLIEFVDADFPWRYSLDVATAGRRKPWLVLIALGPKEFSFVAQGEGPLPRIRVVDAAKSLPDLAQSWAFAHVHVSRDAAATPLPDFMRSHPERHFARLLCPRRLEPNAAYQLFLVPVFEAGRLRGLGDGTPAQTWNALAWSGAGPVDLPVYFQSRFVTSALQDFELLVRRLKPHVVTAADPVGKPAQAFAGKPGYYTDYQNPAAAFQIQDVLVKPGAAIEAYATDPALAPRLARTLAATIAGESVSAGADGPHREDPLVAMPAYGWRYRKETGPTEPKAKSGEWFDAINLDLKLRQVAGLGAEIVRRNQEQFSAICWAQYSGIVEANLRLSRLNAAQTLTARLAARHFERLAPEAAVALSEPLHRFALTTAGPSVSATLRAAGFPASYSSRSLRSTAAKRARTVAAGGPRGHLARRRAIPAPAARATGAGRPDVPAFNPLILTAFHDAIRSLLDIDAFDEPKTPGPLAVGVRPVDHPALAAALTRAFKGLPGRKAAATVSGLSSAETAALDPVLRSPVVPVPLVDKLAAFAEQSLLRSKDALPENCVALVQENRAFIEALLVGANHEMNNELRWREFPTDMRGTIFARFWNRRRAGDDPLGDDIPPIHTWTGKLAANFPPHDDGKPNLVMLLRGDLVRNFGLIIVVLSKLKPGKTVWKVGDVDEFQTVFSGLVGNDNAYYGFDVARDAVLAERDRFFFALYQPAGELRFGLDIATASVRRARFDYQRAPVPFPLQALGRGLGANPVPQHLKGGAPATGAAARWDDLSWTDMALTDAAYVDFEQTHVAVTEPPPLWGPARTSASLARSFLQKPAAAVIPAKRVIA